MYARISIHRSASLFFIVCLMYASGCGTSFNELLFQSASATGRSLLDVLLTDFANSAADAVDQEGTAAQDDQGDADAGDDTIPSDEPAIEDLTGEPAAGEALFAANNCSACHCADASGGCALSAPSIVGVDTGTLDDRVRGEVDHPGGKFDFTNQDIVDLQAHLAGLGAGGG